MDPASRKWQPRRFATSRYSSAIWLKLLFIASVSSLVVLVCGALETPLDGGSIPVKVAELFVAESLSMCYLLDNQELAKIARNKTSLAMTVKLM